MQNEQNDQAVLLVLICMVHWLCVFIMPHTHLEWIYTLRLPDVKKTFARNRRNIGRLIDCNRDRTHKHLAGKRALNPLAKLAKRLSCIVRTYQYGALAVCFYNVAYEFRFNLCPESRCSHWIFRYRTCFEQGVPWHASNFRVKIHYKGACYIIKTYSQCTILISTHSTFQSFGQFY